MSEKTGIVNKRYSDHSSGHNSLAGAIYLLKCLFLLTGILLSIAVFMSLRAANVHPEESLLMIMLAILLPYLTLANVVFVLVMVVRRNFLNPVLWLSMASVMVAGPFLIKVGKTVDGSSGAEFKIATYNIRSLNYGTGYGSSYYPLIRWIEEMEPDVICFQEYIRFTTDGKKNLREALPQYPFVEENICNDSYNVLTGNAIFSKYPFKLVGIPDFGSTVNNAMVCDIMAGPDTIRVVNAHLQTTNLDVYRQRISNELSSGRKRQLENYIKEFCDNMRGSSIRRLSQINDIRGFTDISPYPVILTGDFNESPFSYNYARMAEGMEDGFLTHGQGFGYTFKGLSGMLRIDYILYRGIMAGSYSSPNYHLSDHNPVIMTFLLPSQQP